MRNAESASESMRTRKRLNLGGRHLPHDVGLNPAAKSPRVSPAMTDRLQIERMSREEKLQTMEAIWADLSKTDADIESPAWHEDVLKETEARLAVGRERIADWETAKRELRKRFE